MIRSLLVLAVSILVLPQDPPRDFHGDPLPVGAVARFGTSKFSHVEDVTAFAFEPGGKTLTVVDYGAVHWWNVETGSAVRPPVKKEGRGFPAAFSPDLKRIATGEYRKPDGWIMAVYDAATGKAIRVINEDFSGQPIDVALSSDGAWLASAGTDGQAAIWDVATGVKSATLKGHEGHVMSAAYSNDGKFVATAGADKTIRLWNPKTGGETGRIDTKVPFYNLAVSPDGTKIAAGSPEDRAARVWDVATLKELHRVANKDEVNFNPYFSADGSELVVPTGGVTIFLEIATWRETRRISRTGYYGASSSDGALYAGGHGASVRVWDARSGKLRDAERPQIMGHELWFSPDDAIFKDYGSRIQTWDASTGRRVALVEVSPYHTWLAFSPDRRHYARSSGFPAKVTLHTTVDDKEVGSLTLDRNTSIDALGLSNGATKLAVSNSNPAGLVHVFDIPSGKELHVWREHGSQVSLAFNPAGDLLAAEGKEGWIYLWDLATGSRKLSLAADPHGVGATRFSSDGRILFTAAAAKGIRSWDVETGEAICTMPSDGIMGEPFMDVSRDSQYTAGPFDDRQVKVYETATGQEVMHLKPERGYVSRVAFTNRGDRLVILCHDWNAVAWDLHTPGALRKDAKVEELWEDLASKDAARAYASLCALTAKGGAAVGFLRDRLIRRPPDAATIRKMIDALATDEIEERDKAAAGLARYDAVDEYRKIIAGKDCPEVAATILRGLVSVAKPIRPDDVERIRRLRAITALERGGSSEGTALLRELSECVLDVRIREEAGRTVAK